MGFIYFLSIKSKNKEDIKDDEDILFVVEEQEKTKEEDVVL